MEQNEGKTVAEWIDGIDEKEIKPLKVYQLKEIETRPEQLNKIAKSFGFDGEVHSADGISAIAHEDQVLVSYEDTGAFFYADYSRLHQPEYKPELPTDEEAVKIAEEFLEKNNWMIENVIPDGVSVCEFEQVEGEKREEKSKIPNCLCVKYRFSIDQLQTYGPGAKIKVMIGDGGEIIGLFYAVPEADVFDEVPTLSREDLKDVLRRKLGISIDSVMIRDAKLVYHTDSCVRNKRFIQPAYIFNLTTLVKNKREPDPVQVNFEIHPIPATTFAPIITIEADSSQRTIKEGDTLNLSPKLLGGTPPYKFAWESDIDGFLGNDRELITDQLSVAHRGRNITSHTIKVKVIDSHGMQDAHQVLIRVEPSDKNPILKENSLIPEDPDDPYVGVEWCNIYDNVPECGDISGTDDSARGFKNAIANLPNWSSRFDWGNNNAWEQDFKFGAAPGGGDDTNWADNVHFVFFAGHGGPGRFWFNSSVDDHIMRAQDARLGDGILNWLVLHACETMRSNFGWTVWCDAFEGLHLMFGFHTETEGSDPPLGSRFAFWMSFKLFPWLDTSFFNMRSAWEIACGECFDSGTEFAVIYANQAGTDTQNDRLPGFGDFSADPTHPNSWVYYKDSC